VTKLLTLYRRFHNGTSGEASALYADLFFLAESGGDLVCADRREVIARGVFTSVCDLARKVMRYIQAYSKTARPFRWKYSGVRRAPVCQNSMRRATKSRKFKREV
jgi:hypothetical protein